MRCNAGSSVVALVKLLISYEQPGRRETSTQSQQMAAKAVIDSSVASPGW